MRKLKITEMWENVRQHPDEERVTAVFAPFKEAAEAGVANPFDLPPDLFERLVVSQGEAATINGCARREDAESYFREIIKMAEKNFGRKGREGLIGSLSKMAHHLWSIAALGRSRARERRCHIARRYIICWGERFVCYCD